MFNFNLPSQKPTEKSIETSVLYPILYSPLLLIVMFNYNKIISLIVKSFCLVIALSIFLPYLMYAQNSIKQASPSANFANTFTSTVDLYTGKINVAFNLANLQFGGEDLSVRIKYLAGNGVKVNDLPSWVGLGWGLDAPGYVYRKVKGKPDELQTYKSTISTVHESYGDPASPFSIKSVAGKSMVTELHSQNKSYVSNRSLLGSSDWDVPSKILSYKPSGQNGIPYTSYSGWIHLANGLFRQSSVTNVNSTPVIDLVPDEFSVQVGELSGSFFLNSEGEWTFISNNQLSCKVEVIIDYNYLTQGLRTPGVITKIVLTSSKGMRYTFDGDFESSNVSTAFDFNSAGFSVPAGNYFYDLTPTLWNISKIENLNTQEQIIYSYKPSFYQISKYHSAFGTSNKIVYDNHIIPEGSFFDWNYYTANYRVAHRTKLLEAITCSNGYKIEFNTSLSTQLSTNQSFWGANEFSTDPVLAGKSFKHDLYKLNSVSVFDENTLVSKVLFKYNEKATERLQLERLEFTDGTNISNFVSFNYNKMKLPDYGSREIDHWGYYNGKDFFKTYKSGPYSKAALESYSETYKSANSSLTIAEILESFTTSTGAKTTFEYEPNRYYVQIDDISRQPVPVVGSIYGGGVRIKNVKIEDNQQLLSTNYYYVKEDQSSSGILAQTPPSYISANSPNSSSYYTFRQSGFSSNITNSDIVTYSRVVQKQQDELTTITDFTNFDNGFADLASSVKNFMGSVFDIKDAYSDFSFKRGKIKSVKKMLQGQVLPLEEVIYKYRHDFSEMAHPEYRAVYMSNSTPNFYYSVISYRRYADLPVEEKTVTNKNLESIVSAKSYVYDNYNNLTEELFETSTIGGILKTTYKYPYHFSSSIYQDMVIKNLITPVIEKIESKNNVQLTLLRTNFDYFNSNNILVPKSIQLQIGTEAIQTKKLFHRYDLIGNVLEEQIPDGSKEVLLWGYKNQYMVARIKNSDYTTIAPLLSQSILNNPTSDQQLITIFNDLRTSLPNAFITSNTYRPLVGMTSETDSKRLTTYYDYDTFGRLEYVKDFNKNILKKHVYNYGQNNPSKGLEISVQSYCKYREQTVSIIDCPTNSGIKWEISGGTLISGQGTPTIKILPLLSGGVTLKAILSLDDPINDTYSWVLNDATIYSNENFILGPNNVCGEAGFSFLYPESYNDVIWKTSDNISMIPYDENLQYAVPKYWKYPNPMDMGSYGWIEALLGCTVYRKEVGMFPNPNDLFYTVMNKNLDYGGYACNNSGTEIKLSWPQEVTIGDYTFNWILPNGWTYNDISSNNDGMHVLIYPPQNEEPTGSTTFYVELSSPSCGPLFVVAYGFNLLPCGGAAINSLTNGSAKKASSINSKSSGQSVTPNSIQVNISEVKLYDSSGHLVREGKGSSLNVSGLSEGKYEIHVVEGAKITKREYTVGAKINSIKKSK